MHRLLILLFTLLALPGLAPASIVVIGKLSQKSIVKPGDHFEGVISVKNTSAVPAEARVTQSDYSFLADGSNHYGEPGKASRSNAGWITVTPTRIKLAPGETLPIRYKGRAPADAKLCGTYWSMIMIEPNGAPAIAPDGNLGKIAVGLQTTVRFAVQIITDIGQSGTRSLKVQGKRLVRAAGRRTLELDIANDGERLLVPTVSVELFNAKGVSAGRVQARRASVFPDCSLRAKVDLTGIPDGNYTAMLLLDSGEAQVMGAQYDLELATPPPASTPDLAPQPAASPTVPLVRR